MSGVGLSCGGECGTAPVSDSGIPPLLPAPFGGDGEDPGCKKEFVVVVVVVVVDGGGLCGMTTPTPLPLLLPRCRE